MQTDKKNVLIVDDDIDYLLSMREEIAAFEAKK